MLVSVTLVILLIIPFVSRPSWNLAGSTPFNPSVVLLSVSNNFTSTQSSASNSSLLQGKVSIDEALFISTVPSRITIGKNYTVQVLVTNTLNEQMPMIIQLFVPVQMILVHPVFISAVAIPGQQYLATFTIVAYNRGYAGNAYVNSSVSLLPPSSSTPVVVASVSAPIFAVNNSPYSNIILTSSILVTVLLCTLVYYIIRRNRKNRLAFSAPSSNTFTEPRASSLT